ncbi:hypothetical protein [Streptomyces sp. NPDC057694]
MTELPRIVGVDDHVIEPARRFGTWLPAEHAIRRLGLDTDRDR